MASPARITEVLPETLPGDFVEWDEASPSAQPVQSVSGEPGPGVGVVSKPATQAAEAHRSGSPSAILPHEPALSVSALESTGVATAPHPAQSLSPAVLSSRDIVVLVAVLAVAMIVVFTSEPHAFDDYGFLLSKVPSAKPAADQAPTMTTIQQAEDAAPTRAHSALTVPASTAAATTAGEVQSSSEAARRPVQKNTRPSREQAQMMDDQLHTPTRLQMNAEQAPLPPGGFSATDIDGLDNSKAIGAVFGSPKQPTEPIASQQVVSVPSGVALGLLIQKTQPVYPLIAKEGQVSGIIVLAATISKTGNVENLRVVSGPAMLRMSAVNAVRTWRFKPYMLNNHPTAIETTINVHYCVQAEPCVPGQQAGGFVTADFDGLDKSKAIGTVSSSQKQPTEQSASPQVISVPSGVALGLLIQKTQPVYPLIAQEGHVSGTVVLAVSISKTGNVENLRVVSGPVMLRMSAVNAVRTWRFKPYMLDNQPTAIETTINVHFCGQGEPCVPGSGE